LFRSIRYDGDHEAGRYEILGELGRGAMGVVYKATDPVIGRAVAVKTIKLSEEGTGLSRPELLSRFQTEARAAGLLTHPNIVVVFDAGEEEGLYYITMELVEGKKRAGAAGRRPRVSPAPRAPHQWSRLAARCSSPTERKRGSPRHQAREHHAHR